MASFSGYLRARSDDDLVALLTRRPDLATPSPATLASLAARATSRSSLDRALAGVDALVLQVVEAVVVLTEDPAAPAPSVADVVRAVGADADGPADADAAAPEAGAADAAVGAAVAAAVDLALLWPDDDGLHAAPGLADALGATLAGLAPATSAGDRRRVEAPADPRAVLADAPAGAAQVVDALLWGPPVGRAPAGGPAGQAVDWLVAHGLLVRGDDRHVVLPRDVALRLREGRTHRAPALAPGLTSAPVRPDALVAAESTGAAERTVRLVRQLLHLWEQTPPGVLRAGGLGSRDLRRTAQALDVDEAEAAWLVETAASAGLLADDGEESPSFVPTVEADVWDGEDVPHRWARLARSWLLSARTPWLVGERDERGTLRAALDPELARPWVPRLRRSVLDVLAGLHPGAAPDADAVHALLRWRTPRSVPPRATVDAVLREAGLLGVLGAGALSSAGRALLAEDAALDAGDAAQAPDPAAALAADLPPAVDEVLLQGDLTGVVPGRPSPELEELLETAARVESRGGAMTVRFTADTVRRALDAGASADDLLARLGAASRGRVPQPLEYLVRDVARRHGLLRAGAASAYVRSDDPALLAGLAEDPRLADLGLRALAPTVLVADASTAELLEVLRARGLAPVAEDARGAVVHALTRARRVRGRAAVRARRRAADGGPVHQPDVGARAARVVDVLRRADASAVAVAAADDAPDDPREDLGARAAAVAERARAGRSGAGRAPTTGVRTTPGPSPATRDGGTSDPADALLLLREAAQARTLVWVELVGPDGRSERRLVRPLRVEGGRLRALDPRREAELTVAVHRIASVVPADAPD
ncbi:helicase-associated domain-containing protein [Cellulomonas sp.]|uniref:helicase-associated domain-containing protein n=1 Tax=Cellulomonas sp. TaxID=40001 RepID=UPI00281265F5|nr:helicase-associated domain-containing protein [Cellulomonas sp.]